MNPGHGDGNPGAARSARGRLDPVVGRDAPRRASEADVRRLDPEGPAPGPWVSDDELGGRLLDLLPADPERIVGHLFRLFRPLVEEEIRRVLEEEALVLDVAETALLAFVRLRVAGREFSRRPRPFGDRLRELARETIADALYPDPLEPPLLPPGPDDDPVAMRAAQAAFNRLAKVDRVALRVGLLGDGGHAAPPGVRGRLLAEYRRALASARRDAARRGPGSTRNSTGGGGTA